MELPLRSTVFGKLGKTDTAGARPDAATAAAVWLVCGLILAAFLINLFVIPQQFILPSLYVVPVVIAAQRLRPRVVAAVGAVGILMYGLNALLEKPPWIEIPLAVVALGVISYFAVLLARQTAARLADVDKAQEAIRARDDFLSVAGHELRTPVQAVALLTAGLRLRVSSAAPGDPLTQDLERLGGAVDRLSRLTDQVLDISQIAAGRLALRREKFDLAELAGEVAARFQSGFLAAGCTVDARFDPVRGAWDRARLDQVLTNLLTNAVKYGGGKPVHLRLKTRNGRACLSVRDHGIGIAFEDREKIFERFERAGSARRYNGLGIGLWIVRRIVEAHGGAVEVDSKPGKGAEFLLLLPLK